jgi:hypothetical protein
VRRTTENKESKARLMTTKQNPKFQELVVKLREIFQIDRPELDFGIYRILNARAGEINDYLAWIVHRQGDKCDNRMIECSFSLKQSVKNRSRHSPCC